MTTYTKNPTDPHGVYPPNAKPRKAADWLDVFEWEGQTSKIWDPQDNHRDVEKTHWYGYAGGFGEAGWRKETTGPWGPNKYRDKPSFSTLRCF